jgi:hypothetical protein
VQNTLFPLSFGLSDHRYFLSHCQPAALPKLVTYTGYTTSCSIDLDAPSDSNVNKNFPNTGKIPPSLRIICQLYKKFYCNPDLQIVELKFILIGGVAKRPKATVCKTVIRRFESGRRLSFSYALKVEFSEKLIRHRIKDFRSVVLFP